MREGSVPQGGSICDSDLPECDCATSSLPSQMPAAPSPPEWPRPLSEIARPADNNAELFSLDTDTGKPREGTLDTIKTQLHKYYTHQSERHLNSVSSIYTLP